MKNEELNEGKLKYYVSKKSLLMIICFTVLASTLLLNILFISFIKLNTSFISSTVLQNEDVKKYIQVLNLYEKYSINEIDFKEATDLGIQSLVYNSNDKYGVYLPADAKNSVSDRITTGNYRGIGITYEYQEDKTLLIKEVVLNSPADEAGLKENDIITHIDRNRIDDDVLADFVQKIGTNTLETVELCVNDKWVTLKIGLVEEPKIDYMVKDDVGVIKIYTFVPDTVEKFKEVIDYFKTLKLSKVIFDVRDNGGGDLGTVVSVLDYITDAQKLIELDTTTNLQVLEEIEGSKGNAIYSDSINELSKDISIKVLVNSKTASAAEFFTMTLQDTRGASVIGEQTFGKSTVLSYFTFKDGSMLAMSTGFYYPISCRLIEGVGIPPDVYLSNKYINSSVMELLELNKV